MTDKQHLRIDVTTPLDLSELMEIPPTKTMPIELSQIVQVRHVAYPPPFGGTIVADRRGWLGRVWSSLTRRVTPNRVASQSHV